MSELKFKTNIKCNGCLTKVTPHLNEVEGICEWNVNIYDPLKTLTVKLDKASEEDVIKAVAAAGFSADKLA